MYVQPPVGPYKAHGCAALLLSPRTIAISPSCYIVSSVYLAISCQVLPPPPLPMIRS